MATHSSILASEIPRTEKPGGLQSMGSQILEHDLAFTTETQVQDICCNILKEDCKNLVFISRIK